MTDNAFRPDRDEVLGAALRRHLDAGDHAAFVARVRRAIAASPAPGALDVLGLWFRPGLAAAALIAALAGWWLASGRAAQVAASGTPVEVFAAGAGSDLMLATAAEGR
ncbi:MAG TPA: hypothetical protein VFS07_08945 [Gemmatimonadales bacterium]|nr:hypothetical protein [Gemmatimonadales bacterium]